MTRTERVRWHASSRQWTTCHNTVKLRGLPKAPTTKQRGEPRCGQGNTLGYSNTVGDAQWIIRSQLPRGEAAQRLDGSGPCSRA